MKRWIITCLTAAAFCLLQAGVCQAQTTRPSNSLLKNGDFTANATGSPEGWDHRTPEAGMVQVMKEGDLSFVRIGVKKPDETSFIQQVMPIPAQTVSIGFRAKFRYADIVKGAEKYQSGAIQARFMAGGKEIGKWVDLAKPEGTSADWVEVTKRATVPVDPAADAVLLRLAVYGVKSGYVDVASASVEALNAQTLDDAKAAQRTRFRPAERYGSKPSPARLARLARGVNINGWFNQTYNYTIGDKKGTFTPEWFNMYLPDADIKSLKDAGLTNVRLVVEPEIFMDLKDGSLRPKYLPDLDLAIKRLTSAGLAVQLDFHPNLPTLKAMAGKTELVEAYAVWVGQISAHLAKTTDPEMVFIELLNEPIARGFDVDQWIAYQDRLVAEARKNAPEHTLIGNPGGWAGYADLKYDPPADRNMVICVHYYDPMPFTHQGTPNMRDWYKPLRNMPWPCDETNLQQAIASLDQSNKEFAAHAEKVLKNLVDKGNGTPERVNQHFDQITEWSKKYDTAIVINEFGVRRPFAKDEDTERWLSHVRKTAEAHGFGWTLWEYNREFRLVTGDPGQRQFDPAPARALGLITQPAGAK